MKQILLGTLALLLGLIACTSTGMAWEKRLRHLRPLDVQKNVERLLQLNECRYCFLRGANLYEYDLRNADLTGADLSGAIWSDGTKCLPGSIGMCKKPQPQP